MIQNETIAAKLRMTTTGHGQEHMNAAEFAEFTHHIHIDGEEVFAQHLWKDDCGSNSAATNGTYLYSRAGWCPGQDVQPGMGLMVIRARRDSEF